MELPSTRGMAPKRFVYVLKTCDSTPRYYVGVTSDVEHRTTWHNQGHCRHTAKHRPWQPHVVIEFDDEPHARIWPGLREAPF